MNLKLKKCKHAHVVKMGKDYKGTQRLYCKDCKTFFRSTESEKQTNSPKIKEAEVPA